MPYGCLKYGAHSKSIYLCKISDCGGINQSKACIVRRPNSQEPVRVTVYINSSLFELKYENPHVE